MELNEELKQVYLFAKQKHQGQLRVDGNGYVPYINHCKSVCEIVTNNVDDNEVNLPLAQKIALLHDTVEDTGVTFEELEKLFGTEVATGVLALTKNENLPKHQKMQDSLERILRQPKEVAIVKMADRIDNLAKPNPKWSYEKSLNYTKEAMQIYDALNKKHPKIANVLYNQIQKYKQMIQEFFMEK